MDVTPVQPPPKIGAATELVFKQELSEGICSTRREDGVAL